MIYTLTLNPAIDYVIGLEKLHTGAINRTKSESIVIGGKGINVSLVLSELGTASTALGFVAGFTGELIKEGLDAAGVKHDFVDVPTGFSRINVKIKADTESEINGMGPKISWADFNTLLEKLTALSDGDALIIAGSVPPSMPDGTYEKILYTIDKSGKDIKLVVDITGAALSASLKYKPLVIKPNIHELREIVGKSLEGDGEIEAAARELQSRGARNVLVSMGKDGALLVSEDGAAHRIFAHEGELVSSVSAGDSMLAGFLSYILSAGDDCDYGAALRLANACGAAAAFSYGTPTRDMIESLFDR